MNIEIGKTYNCFDDGKIRENRRYEVKITDIIPFNNINEEILNLWKNEVKSCHWLYKHETDYFIKGEQIINKNTTKYPIFVRTKDNKWFSLGFWGSILDVDGSLTKISQNL